MHVMHKAFLTTAILAVGGASVPAQAQLLTLQSGDNVTVGSTGTSGTYLGAPINNNATNSYVLATFSTPVIATAANSTFTLNSGGSITNNGSGFSGDALDATNSAININGGNITNSGASGIYANGGNVNITSGTLNGFDGLFTRSANVNISGGTISGFVGGFTADFGTANITGGTFTADPQVGNAVSLLSNSFATISGGSFSQGGLGVGTGSTIDLLGTFSQTAPITGGTGTLTGTLLDGETLTATYNVSQGGLIEFNSAPVPEASSVVSFGLLLALGLGGLTVSARRRKAQSAG